MVKNFTYKTSNKIWTKVLVLLFVTFLSVSKSRGQTIAIQDFESTPLTPTWAICAGATFTSTNLGASDTPANQRVRGGARSWQTRNATNTLELCAVSVLGCSSVQISVYASSTSTNSTNGADAADQLKLYTNIDGAGYSATPDITVSGNSNARWGYNTTGVSTTAGTPVSVSGTSGTNAGTIYSKLTINIPSGASSVALKIVANNNDGTEVWNIDDVEISGSCSSCSAPTTTISPTTQTVCAGSTATIGIGTSAASPNYTWQASANGSTGWANVVNGTPTGASYSGASAATLTITAGSTYYYRCLVADGTSTCVATSGTSSLTVNSAPTITTQTTPSSTVVCAGTATSFSVGATGTSLSYQWQVSTGGAFSNATGGAYTNETTNKLNIGTAQAAGVYTFQCVISNSCGTLTSTPVTLTVAAIPAMPVTPTIIATCVPAVVSETVVGTPPAGVTWYWQTSSTATSTLNPASVDYTLTATGNVFVRALNASGCWNNTPTTSSVAVTVTKSPTITTQPASTVACQGSTASIKVSMNSGSTTPLTFQWQENTGSGFTNISSGSPYTISVGTYTSTLDIDGTKPIGTYTYQCIISNSCGTVTTNIVTVSVTATPANDLCSNASTLVIGASPVIGNLNCASPTSGLTYVSSRNDVWYAFTPTCTATHTVTMTFTTSGADYDLDIFNTASCPSSGSATFTAHGSTTVETIAQTFVSGVTYYIRVIDYNTSGGTFSINAVSSCGPPRTVTFDPNGGTGTMSSQTSGSAANLNSNTYTNSGCFFVAWNTAADGTGTSYADGAVYSFTADITLYAQWNCSGGSSFSCTGAIGNGKTQGCGDTGPCNLSTIGTYLDGVACATTLNASCTGACDVQTPFSRQFTVPAGCTATITAEMKVRASGCSNSGMDSGDQLAITNSGGSVISQTATLSNGGTVTGSSINKNSGTGNADGWVQMIITGGDITVSGSGQRGDEIVTYTVNFVGSCGSGCNTILPITLLDFYGVHKGNTNELVWRVAEESNIKRYVIEKSNNGVDFVHMIGVYPTEGSYNKTYRTEDLSPYSGITYYRLVTMENDYSLQYHKTISLESNSKKWSYYCYQTNNSLNIEFKNTLPEDAVVSLYDMSGQMLVEEQISNSNAVINTSNIASGIYFVRISNPYKTENFKVVISK